MSDAQKLAWAKEHDVKVPEAVAARAAAGHTCCSQDNCDTSNARPATGGSDWHVVLIDSARKCQGLASLWMVLGQAMLPPESQSLEADLSIVSWLAPKRTAQAISPAFDPATPPPRAAL